MTKPCTDLEKMGRAIRQANAGRDRWERIVEQAFEAVKAGSETIGEISAACNIRHNTVDSAIRALVKAGRIEARKHGPRMIYTLPVEKPPKRELPEELKMFSAKAYDERRGNLWVASGKR